ncbi:fam-e protein [Plasmodium gallinaceum]|uniref:Fam-e protein n=1 Tax=Plasmodium gallinaceum TaxID=5849 RepID=A0A1J1GPH5_PLAGA|nr:fam-e protein [Plasmodium gallinaceum]CRG94409.1 fam-e protein [Plasmodium gallinaceum]
MALLYNRGCDDFEGDSVTCHMAICHINPYKFETSHCPVQLNSIKVYRPLDNVSNDISKNIFKYKRYGPYKFSRIIILSNNDQDGIVFLYELNPYMDNFPIKTYLCRLRSINQMLSLCESIDPYYLDKNLSFNSYDIINEKNDVGSLKHIKNPRHQIIISKYKDLFHKEHSCHLIKSKFFTQLRCVNYLCEKNNEEYNLCTDANYSGKLVFLDYDRYDKKIQDLIYLPESCLKKDSNFACTPYFCQKRDISQFSSCEYQEISAIKNIATNSKSLDVITTNSKSLDVITRNSKSLDLIPRNSKSLEVISTDPHNVYHENNLNAPALFAMTFMPFLILFVFFWCYIYKLMKKKRRKIY